MMVLKAAIFNPVTQAIDATGVATDIRHLRLPPTTDFKKGYIRP